MAADPILDEHHFVRLCPFTRLDGDRPEVSLFVRKRGEDGLSGNWLEHYGGETLMQQLGLTKTAMSRSRALGANSRFAILPVGAVRLIPKITSEGHLSVRHDPDYEKNNLGHSLIVGTPEEGDPAGPMVAVDLQKAVLEPTHRVGDVDALSLAD